MKNSFDTEGDSESSKKGVTGKRERLGQSEKYKDLCEQIDIIQDLVFSPPVKCVL